MGREFVTVPGNTDYVLDDSTAVEVKQDNGKLIFGSTMFASGDDNPRVRELTAHQKKMAVTLKYKHVSEFMMHTEIGDTGFAGTNGRFFHFAGASSLNCPPVVRAMCSTMECPEGMVPHVLHQEEKCIGEFCGSDDTELCCMSETCSMSNFYFNGDKKWGNVVCSNLGGFGPDADCAEEIRYDHVATYDGKDLD